LKLICHAHGATASAALPVPTALIGSLETGFAPGAYYLYYPPLFFLLKKFTTSTVLS
jgi:hypothetical protein